MKALVLHHPYTRPRFEQDYLDRLAQLPEFDVERGDLAALDEGRIRGSKEELALGAYDAVVIFVAFSQLRQAPPLRWEGYAGLRVLLEHDAIQNYSDLFDPTLMGTWPPVFHRHRFDLMVTSGRAVQQRFAEDAIAAEWVPKAFEPRRFADLDGARSGIVTYGSAYRCRVVAERAIAEAGLPLVRLPTTPYPELGTALARHLACLAISSDLLTPLALRDELDRTPPGDVAIRPGLEPMAKFFEGAGAGCCPVADDMEDLKALGFHDSETAITFRSHDELVERLRWWLARPEELRDLGRAAARLAHSRHTWAHRAAELRQVLARRIAG